MESNGEQRIEQTASPPTPFNPLRGEFVYLPDRKISEKTLQKYGYTVGERNGVTIHIADLRHDGELVAQKIRKVDTKEFFTLGNLSSAPLFGGHLWKRGGRKIVITEGELDCLSIAEMYDCKWPVVSLPSGAAGAEKCIRSNLEFLSSYEEVVLCFDNDEAGRTASSACADLLPAGRCKIVELPLKDASEMLVAGRGKELNNCIWEARTHSPAGILHASDVRHEEKASQRVWSYPFTDLTDFLIGQRSGELVMWTSGTGSGKSTVIRELANHHLIENRTVGLVMLEEAPTETVDDLISLRINKQVRRIRAMRELNKLRMANGQTPRDYMDDLTDDEYAEARAKLNDENLYVYDSHGVADFGSLYSRIEYMAVGLQCDVIILDHITAAIAGQTFDEDGMNSERLAIDELMKNLRQLVERTGVHIDVISQLRKAQGKQYEEGGRIGAQDLRGSGSLASVPNVIIALERNRQHKNHDIANTSVLRVLKNRFNGVTGIASAVRYDHAVGRMVEVQFAHDAEGKLVFGD